MESDNEGNDVRLNVNDLIDRRLLLRKLTAWKSVSIASVVILLFVIGMVGVRDGGGPYIARVSIDGFIEGDREKEQLFRQLADDDDVAALILSVNSPGGTAEGSEVLYEAIRYFSDKKPVVVTMGAIATSGGYVVALAGDYIFARENTITGSIGVIFQWPQVSDFLKNWDIRFDSIRSSVIKGHPDPFSKTPEPARQMIRDVVDDSYNWFVILVKERRNMSASEVQAVSQGQVYTGTNALRLNLIDSIGGEDAAIGWLANVQHISPDLEVRDRDVEHASGNFIVDYITDWVSFSEGSFTLRNFVTHLRHRSSGLYFLWQGL